MKGDFAMIKKKVKSIFVILTFSAALISTIGCPVRPRVTLEPEKYCATSKIKIQWKHATSDMEISAIPDIFQKFAATPSTGSANKSIDSSKIPNSPPYEIDIIIKGTYRGEPFEYKRTAQVLPPGATEKLSVAFTPDCSGGDPPAWSESIIPDLWDNSIKIKSVGNMSGRTIWIGHGSSPSVELQSNGYTNSFNNQSPSGTWNANTKLKEPDLSYMGSSGYYESCQPVPTTTGHGSNAIHQPPPSLKIIVTYGCN